MVCELYLNKAFFSQAIGLLTKGKSCLEVVFFGTMDVRRGVQNEKFL